MNALLFYAFVVPGAAALDRKGCELTLLLELNRKGLDFRIVSFPSNTHVAVPVLENVSWLTFWTSEGPTSASWLVSHSNPFVPLYPALAS